MAVHEPCDWTKSGCIASDDVSTTVLPYTILEIRSTANIADGAAFLLSHAHAVETDLLRILIPEQLWLRQLKWGWCSELWRL